LAVSVCFPTAVVGYRLLPCDGTTRNLRRTFCLVLSDTRRSRDHVVFGDYLSRHSFGAIITAVALQGTTNEPKQRKARRRGGTVRSSPPEEDSPSFGPALLAGLSIQQGRCIHQSQTLSAPSIHWSGRNNQGTKGQKKRKKPPIEVCSPFPALDKSSCSYRPSATAGNQFTLPSIFSFPLGPDL